MDTKLSINPKQSSSETLQTGIRLWALALPRRAKQAAMLISDFFGFASTAFVSYWAVAGPTLSIDAALMLAGITIVTAITITWISGLYVSIVRYMGLDLIAIGARATFLVAMIVSFLGGYLSLFVHPVRFGIVFWSTMLLYLVGGRLLARLFLNRRNKSREGVIIYGAGDAGAQLIETLFSADDYLPVAIVDDDELVQGRRVHGLRVYGPDYLDELLTRTGATGVLLAVPTASRRRRRAILENLSNSPVHVKTMPEIKDIVSGKARVDEISDVEVGDLLGRDAVPPNDQLLEACVKGKSVMVTGAGGSIGSELCQQILELKPKRLVCLDVSEPALYSIDRELKKKIKQGDADCDVIALLGSVYDIHRVRDAMDAFGVQTVYHAAAYKHVPLVEHNLLEGIGNNVLGTLHTACAAIEAGVETFVLISTDKAVNPTSVMGATKRLAEMVLQAYAHQNTTTRFCMVRFGNVLESSGSVVPLFREQIRRGGPVTVTHRDIIRYFMTIPEAAELVIQAGAMAKGGDVFVLDMGEPVRVKDLAYRMINLMGLSVLDEDNPEGDIEIKYVGLRPAEKLYEELLIGSNVTGTRHPRICRADEDFLPLAEVSKIVEELESSLEHLDFERARMLLAGAVKEYQPANGIEDRIWMAAKGKNTAALRTEKIVDFPGKDVRG